jgi:hypothetical protein
MRTHLVLRLLAAIAAIAAIAAAPAWGQVPGEAPAAAAAEIDRAELFKKFEQMLAGVVLEGHFTVTGKEDQAPKAERYEISSVTKLEAGDYWLFKARIKYGDNDATLPLPIEVKWAGSTPLITLDNVTIPGLGTFDARVVIAENKYAGTWRHGNSGGHLFGTIKKKGNNPPPDKPPQGEGK